MIRLMEYIVVAALAIGGAYLYAWYNKPPIIPPGVTVEATPAQEVKREAPTVTINPPAVKVYKDGVKGKLKLPQSVIDDPNQHVMASGTSANDERRHTFTAVINQQTGKVQMFDRTEAQPWLAVNTKSEIGIYYGIKAGEQALRVEGRQELLQVKALHFGAIASADVTRTGTDGFIGIGAWARW